jgi:hypothetical protein
MKKSFWILMIAVVLGAVIYMNLSTQEGGDTENAVVIQEGAEMTTAQKVPQGADILTGMYGLAGVEWVFTEKTPGDGFRAPVTTARVQPVGVTRPDGRTIEVSTWRMGDQQGSCAEIAKPADEKIAAISYAQCWWAGGGNQFRAVRDGNVLRVDVRSVDEEETAPATFKQLVVIDLASIAQ